MNPFSFLGINPVSFGAGRTNQRAADIAELNRETSEVVVISDTGVAKRASWIAFGRGCRDPAMM